MIDGPLHLYANDMQLLLASAMAGVGIAYGPTFVFGPEIACVHLVLLLTDHQVPELTIQALYPTTRHVLAKVRSFY